MRERRVRRGDSAAGDVLKGLAAGAAAGLVASWAMNQFQSAWSRRMHGVERSHGAQSLQTGAPDGDDAWPRGRVDEREAERRDAAERVAAAVAEGVAGRELTKAEQDKGGTVVHYAYGAAMGAAYGAAAEFAPVVTAGYGVPFGAVFWLVADEIVTPALGLSKPAEEYPASIHAYALSSHLVYGLAAELVRRAVRQTI